MKNVGWIGVPPIAPGARVASAGTKSRSGLRLAREGGLGAASGLIGEFALLEPEVRRTVVSRQHGRSAGRV